MPRTRTITVETTDTDIESKKNMLRSLRPLGVRFSVTTEDGKPATVNVWREEGAAAPAAPRTRNRTTTVPAASGSATTSEQTASTPA